MAARFRNSFRYLVPAWRATGDGERELYAYGLIKDAFLERVRQGLEARFPTRAAESALELIGRDRGIIRGRSESAAAYAARLVAWRYPRGHRVRGNPFALLSQVRAYFGGTACATIDVRGNLDELCAAGAESFAVGQSWDWDNAPVAPRWARFWLLVGPVDGSAPQPDFDDPGMWADDAPTVGVVGVTPDDCRAIRRLFKAPAWKPAGVRAEWLVFRFDGSLPAPDGPWGTWSADVAGVREPTRDNAYRYVSLSPATNNTYTGDADAFADTVRMPDGTAYAGADAWHGTITLPTGSDYTGDPATFTASLRLIDDGDPAI